MKPCLAIGCADEQLSSEPLCARHWSMLPRFLQVELHHRARASEFPPTARLVMTESGQAVVAISVSEQT